VTDSRTPGLRLQIILALAGLMLLAFLPLYVAVASLTRATVLGARESAALAVVRAVALHVTDAERYGHAEVQRVLESHVSRGGIEGLTVFDTNRTLVASAGDAPRRADGASLSTSTNERAELVRSPGSHARVFEIATAAGEATLVAHVRADEGSDGGAPLVRLVALYMTIFALALLTFAYFVLTRLIVKPVDALVRAADRVASGSRALIIPNAGARELAQLGESVQAMTSKLVADEADMRTKVEQLTRTTERLRDAQSQVARSERLASVGRLAAGVAHEVGNPIAAIMGMEDLLLEGDLPESTQRDFLMRMKRETERINTVVRDLLDFARPEQESKAGDPPSLPADVASVVSDVVALVKPQKDFREITVKTEFASDGAASSAVRLPPARLTQVVLNVVLNAGFAIAKSKREGNVVIRVRVLGAVVRIEIEDDGPGVPSELRDRIFEPFMTTKDVGEGTGLGLSVCRGLVEAAGGSIGIDPAWESGARFYVELPSS
jgi:two-component system NtrC family sensor kinase